MRLLTNLACFLAGLIVALAVSSFAGGSVGVGACRHTGLDEGVWGQQQFDGFKGNVDSACVEAQWMSSGKSGWSIGLAHLGYLHGSSLATIDDNTYEMKTYTGGACQPNGKNCLARFDVDSAEYGVTLGLFTKVGPVTLEGGVFVYRSNFNVAVYRIGEESGYPEFNSYHIRAYHNTPYLGIAARSKDLYARLRVYQEINQDGAAYPFKGLTSGPVIALTAGVTF